MLTSFCGDLCSRHVVLILANAKGQSWTDHAADTETNLLDATEKGIYLTHPPTDAVLPDVDEAAGCQVYFISQQLQ